MAGVMFKLTTAGHPPAVYGITANDNGIVITSSRILKFMLGWNTEDVQEYCNRTGWTMEKLEREQSSAKRAKLQQD